MEPSPSAKHLEMLYEEARAPREQHPSGIGRTSDASGESASDGTKRLTWINPAMTGLGRVFEGGILARDVKPARASEEVATSERCETSPTTACPSGTAPRRAGAGRRGHRSARRRTSLVVGAHPANPTNSVVVRYRVDGGARSDGAGAGASDRLRSAGAVLRGRLPGHSPPAIWSSTRRSLSCAGRQVPAPHVADRFPSKFRLAAKETPAAAAGPAGPRRGAASHGSGSTADWPSSWR